MGLCFSSHVWAESVVFNWQHQRVVVTETKTKNNRLGQDKTFKISYPVELKKHDKGWLVDYGSVKFLEMNGQKLDDDAQSILGNVLGKVSQKADIIIDEKGQPIEIVDWQEYLNAMSQIDPKGEQVVNNLKSKSELETLFYAKTLTEPWCVWVCQWSDIDFTAQGSTQQMEDSEFMDYNEQVKYRLVNKINEQLHLEMHSTMHLKGISSKISLTQVQTKQDRQAIQNEKIARETLLTAILDSKTGEPKQVSYHVIIRDGDGKQQATETTNYEFDWR